MVKGNNRNEKLKALSGKGSGGVVPPLSSGRMGAPKNRLETVRDMREEMKRIYKLTAEGSLSVSDATKMVYLLDRMIQAIKTETELNEIANAYSNAWSGVSIITDQNQAAKIVDAEVVDVR